MIPERMPPQPNTPIGWSPNALGLNTANVTTLINAQVPPLITAAIAAIPAEVAIISNPSTSLGAATFIIARRLLTLDEMRSAADIIVIDAQPGRVLMPCFAWVHTVTGAVVFSSNRTASLCWTAGGNPVTTAALVQTGPNTNNWRSFAVQEAAAGTHLQAVGLALVLRSTSAAVTGGDATCSAEVFCGVMVMTP